LVDWCSNSEGLKGGGHLLFICHWNIHDAMDMSYQFNYIGYKYTVGCALVTNSDLENTGKSEQETSPILKLSHQYVPVP